MVDALSWEVLAVVGLALAFAFLNGVLDSASLVAAAVSSRSLAPRSALALASLAEFLGPFLFGTAVAATIGGALVESRFVTPSLVAAALGGALLWNLLALAARLPTSSSHALVGGLMGAAVAEGGPAAIQATGLLAVLLALILGPAVCLAAGYVVLRLLGAGLRSATPGVNRWLRMAQAPTVAVLALSHGTNDAQKTMGAITMALVSVGATAPGAVPLWVVAASAGALALGVASGGTRILRTLGGGLYRLRPVHGFASQSVAALAILGGTFLGAPLSTGQVVGSAILGVGAAHRRSAVRWVVARNMVMAWLFTMPGAGLMAGLAYKVLSLL